MPFSVRDLSSLGAVWSRPAQETRLPVSLSCQGLGVGDRYSVKPQAEASHQFIHSLTHSFIHSPNIRASYVPGTGADERAETDNTQLQFQRKRVNKPNPRSGGEKGVGKGAGSANMGASGHHRQGRAPGEDGL